jgi:hypothetical protein
MLAFYAWYADLLRGWLDVFQFNRYYANLRQSNTNTIDRVVSPLWEADKSVFNLLTGTAVAILFTAININIKKLSSPFAIASLSQIYTFAISSFIILIIQSPPAFQHYLIIVGPLVACIVFSIGLKIRGCLYSSSNLLIQFSTFTLLAFLTYPSYFNRDISKKWGELTQPGSLYPYFGKINIDSKIIIFAGNQHRLDLTGASDKIMLGCKFFYYYEHLDGYLSNELNDCYQQPTDYLIIENKYLENNPIRNIVEKRASEDFVECNINDTYFKIYSNLDNCAMLTSHYSN